MPEKHRTAIVAVAVVVVGFIVIKTNDLFYAMKMIRMMRFVVIYGNSENANEILIGWMAGICQ